MSLNLYRTAVPQELLSYSLSVIECAKRCHRHREELLTKSARNKTGSLAFAGRLFPLSGPCGRTLLLLLLPPVASDDPVHCCRKVGDCGARRRIGSQFVAWTVLSRLHYESRSKTGSKGSCRI
mmetsp:Transcript_256/g.827  ORF Transcript_256/g.827 Transcript_256/m.827 type:complete len:123 (+) Transcript_256:126-494(+)